MSKEENKSTLLTGNVAISLIKFTIPILIAMAIQMMYTSVDMMIVGRFATVSDVSGVSSASQLTNLLTTICTGLATGATIYIGHKIGEKKEEEIGSIITNSICLFMIMSIIIMAILIIFKQNAIQMLNTPKEAIKETTDYLFYASLGIPMIFAYNILGSIFRGIGDSKTPMIAVTIASVINIILDLVFVASFNMGAGGAALATVIAQTMSVVLSIVIIKKKNTFIYKLEIKNFKFNKTHVKKVISLGFPVALQSTLVSLSFLIITIIINKFGVVFSASVGLSEKITGIIMLVPISFMQSLSVYVAQNVGSKEYKRAKESLLWGMAISIIFGAIMAAFAYFRGDILAKLFSNDEEVIKQTSIYLKAYAFDTLLVPVMFSLTGYFNGCGKTVFVMIQGVVGALLIRVPLAYIFSTIEPTSLFIIGLSTPIATAFQIVLCFIYYVYTNKQFNKLKSIEYDN